MTFRAWGRLVVTSIRRTNQRTENTPFGIWPATKSHFSVDHQWMSRPTPEILRSNDYLSMICAKSYSVKSEVNLQSGRINIVNRVRGDVID